MNIIAWDTTIPNDKVKINVQNGWMTLSGEVEWNYQKTAAEDAVYKLSGVLGVSNQISVRPHVDASNIKNRIEDVNWCNAEIQAGGIRVDVSGGMVTLEGKVNSWHERGVAERAAWAVPGVVIVEDRLAVS